MRINKNNQKRIFNFSFYITFALRGVSVVFKRLRGVNIVLTLSRPLSMLPNTGVRLLGVSILFNSLSTDCDLYDQSIFT